MKKILLAGALALSGCAGVNRAPIGDKAEVEVRSSVTLDYYDLDLPKKIQTTKVHPDDESFLSGETTADVEDGSDLSWTPGIGVRTGDKFRLKTGIDARLNFGDSDGYKSGIYERERQISDNRGEYGSWVYSKFSPTFLTPIPYVGLEAELNDVMFDFEFGMPYSKFIVESGHDRYGEWENVKRDSWEGFGKRFKLGVKGRMSEDFWLGAGVVYEDYDVEFMNEDGNVKNYTLFLSISGKF